MEHTPAGKHEWNPSSEETFTGKVWSSFLSKAEDRTVTAIGVMFGPGARSYWHSHPEGQLLYVTSGAGRAGSADGKVVEIAAGDVVYTAGGEQHWHGANPTSYMTHVSLTTGGTTIWTPKEVTDEEYNNV